MLTQQTTTDGGRKRTSKKSAQVGPMKRASNPDDFGETILFIMLVIIVLVLAVIMNAAIRETVYFIREVLSM
jgi:hypothetical protein